MRRETVTILSFPQSLLQSYSHGRLQQTTSQSVDLRQLNARLAEQSGAQSLGVQYYRNPITMSFPIDTTVILTHLAEQSGAHSPDAQYYRNLP